MRWPFRPAIPQDSGTAVLAPRWWRPGPEARAAGGDLAAPPSSPVTQNAASDLKADAGTSAPGRIRVWHWIFAGLLLGNIVCLSVLWRVTHRVQALEVAAQNAVQGLQVAMQGLQATAAGNARRDERAVADTGLAYAETPEGLRPVPANEGLSRDDIAFVSRFRGHIVDTPVRPGLMKHGEMIAKIGSDIKASFERDPANRQLGRTPRAALVAYALLRTRGSISTFQTRDNVPHDAAALILATSGNCAEFTLRLMMVLESIGLRASTVSVYTPHLMGHIVVDAYHPEEDTAYLLDPSFSVLIARPRANRTGFMATVLQLNADQRQRMSEDVEIRAFPDYYRFVDPGEQGLKATPLTAQFINQQMVNREPMWRKWLALDALSLANWWKTAPTHAPRTLAEFRRDFVKQIPVDFDRSGDYASLLRAAASRFLAAQPQAVKTS